MDDIQTTPETLSERWKVNEAQWQEVDESQKDISSAEPWFSSAGYEYSRRTGGTHRLTLISRSLVLNGHFYRRFLSHTHT